jgi:hypothetical protein
MALIRKHLDLGEFADQPRDGIDQRQPHETADAFGQLLRPHQQRQHRLHDLAPPISGIGVIDRQPQPFAAQPVLEFLIADIQPFQKLAPRDQRPPRALGVLIQIGFQPGKGDGVTVADQPVGLFAQGAPDLGQRLAHAAAGLVCAPVRPQLALQPAPPAPPFGHAPQHGQNRTGLGAARGQVTPPVIAQLYRADQLQFHGIPMISPR